MIHHVLRRPSPGRWAASALVAAVAVALPGGRAMADPAGPTDYRTTIESVTPPAPGVEVSVVGSDSFLHLAVQPGVEVLVPGYQQEPYLRFRADGVVEQNERAPTTYVNEDRDGGAAVPAGADPGLAPNWRTVATGGRYAWHDHRAHWMQASPPAGAARGEEIQRSVVPIVVDGTSVEIAVATTWLPEPSREPLAVGAVAGAAAVLAAVLLRRRVAWALLAASAAAAGIGWWQYRSLPAETGPLTVWWLLPVTAGVACVVALVLGWRTVSFALVLLAALQLGAWVVIRRDGAFRAALPTDAPWSLDRGVLAASAVVATVAGLGALVAMFRAPSR